MLWEFGKPVYVMIKRLPNRLIDECSGNFRYLCVVYWFVNASVHQNVKDFVHKNSRSKIDLHDLSGNHLTITYSFREKKLGCVCSVDFLTLRQQGKKTAVAEFTTNYGSRLHSSKCQ